jgi:hypothetical protein
MRARVDELDATIAEAKLGRGTRSEQRHALVGELETAREAARARLGEVVAALETIRLDLLRLRAGVGSVAGITEDLSAAREVGEQAERLLAAEQEVEAAIKSDPGAPPP